MMVATFVALLLADYDVAKLDYRNLFVIYGARKVVSRTKLHILPFKIL